MSIGQKIIQKAKSLFSAPAAAPSDQEFVALFRSRSKEIASALALALTELSSCPVKEQIPTYEKTIKLLCKKYNDAIPVHQDTTAVDEKILNLAKQLPDVLRSGDSKVIFRVLEGITYGANNARKDFIGTNDEWETVDNAHIEKLEMYTIIAELNAKNILLQDTVEKQKEQLEYSQNAQCEVDEKVLELEAKRPDLVEELAMFTSKDKLSADALFLSNLRERSAALLSSAEQLSRTIALNEALHQDNIHEIENTILKLSQGLVSLSQEIRDTIKQTNESYAADLQKIISEIKQREAENSLFEKTLEAIYTGPDMVDLIVSRELRYVKVVENRMTKAAADARAATLRAENTNAALTN